MFEEANQNNPTQEPQDMFKDMDGLIEPGEVKSALANQKLKPVTRSAVSEESEVEITQPFLSKKGMFLTIGVVLVVLLGGGIGYSVWRSAQKTPGAGPLPAPGTATEQPVTPPAGGSVSAPDTDRPTVVNPPATEQPVTATPPVQQSLVSTDTDNDGLSDAEEQTLGTDPTKIDTDADGLTDYEEVVIWKTNPLNPDTDGDTYSDGSEVKNGYNPLGAGKLLELPK